MSNISKERLRKLLEDAKYLCESTCLHSDPMEYIKAIQQLRKMVEDSLAAIDDIADGNGEDKQPTTSDTFVIGINDGKITFLKSYNYLTQKDEAQKDLDYVQDRNKFSGWYISHVGSWFVEHKNNPEDRFEITIPIPSLPQSPAAIDKE